MRYPSKTELTISVEQLHDMFTYDPETGSLKWKVRKWTDFKEHKDWFIFCSRNSCKEAGATEVRGYRQVNIQAKKFKVHRVIWAMQTGKWPVFEIDHINHDRADNRWANLRAAPGNVNGMNRSRPKSNTSGVMGVSYYEDTRERKWRARVKINGKLVFQKYFSTKAEAACAVLAARTFHGFHPNHGQLNS